MYGEKTSLELYAILADNSAEPCEQDVVELMDKMKEELLLSGYSDLLDVAYATCHSFCNQRFLTWSVGQPADIDLYRAGRKLRINVYDAWFLANCLGEYMSTGDLSTEMLACVKHLFGNHSPAVNSSRDLAASLRKIDEAVVSIRKKMYSTFKTSVDGIPQAELEKIVITNAVKQEVAKQTEQARQETEEEKQRILSAARSQAEKEKTDIIEEAKARAESEKTTILDHARQQAESEKKALLADARQQADEIVAGAQRAADIKIAEAKKRIDSDGAQKRLEAFSEGDQKIQDSFSDVRNALLQSNEMLKKLEDAVLEATTKKVYTQLIELYNLIADTKETAISLAQQNNDQDLENAAYNMDVFMDMISEYLADFGIQTISSTPGEPFAARLHSTKIKNMQFDPRSASIKKSIRSGFVWGEQVLQKERVEI